MSKCLGIDLGSTNSAFSIFEGNEAKLITNSDGQRTTQSIVAFTKNGDELVGSAAARQMVTNSKNTITLVKRLIGRKFEEVKDFIKDFSYEIVAAANGDCRIKINDKEYSPEEISAKILSALTNLRFLESSSALFRVFSSISKPRTEEKRKARIMRRASSSKRLSGSPTHRITPFSRSEIPPKRSTIPVLLL